MNKSSVYRSGAWASFVLDYMLARDASREHPSPGALPRNPDAPRIELDVCADDGPRGAASCGGVELRCDAAAGAFDAVEGAS